MQQARHEVETLSAGYSYICLIHLETGDVELIKGNTIYGLKGRYTQMDHNILLEQVNRLIPNHLGRVVLNFMIVRPSQNVLKERIPYSILVKGQMELGFFR